MKCLLPTTNTFKDIKFAVEQRLERLVKKI